MEVYGAPLPAELIAKVFGVRKLVDYLKEYLHFYDWMSKMYKQKLDEYFTSGCLSTTPCMEGATRRAQRFTETLKNFIERYGYSSG